MTPTMPNVDPKGLYGVTAAAKALGVNASTITRASKSTDKCRALPFKIRKSSGRKVFKGQDLINYWLLTY